MKILIIGGTRFVGPHVIQKLKNHELTLFNRGNNPMNFEGNIRQIKGDRNEGFNISEKFDAVIDMCAYNGKHTTQVLSELQTDYYFHFGTIASYKKTNVFPLTEESPIGEWKMWGDYNKGKVECEEVLKNSNTKHGIIRPVFILGAANHKDREAFIYRNILQDKEINLPGNGQAILQFVFAQDVADIIANVVENEVTGSFNVAGDEMITLQGLVEIMADIVGKKARIKYDYETDGLNFNEKAFPFPNEHMVCSNEKVKGLGIKFTSLVEGLRSDYDNDYKRLVK
jgi:2'-hydroxyisoflavone reductase